MIEKGLDIVVKGPCKIKVIQGSIDIAGIEINDEINLHEPRTFTITTLSESELVTDCQVLAKYPSLDWRKIGEELGGKIIIIGSEDSGKSYFANMVSNLKEIPIIDADVGQSSLFIPTFISLSRVKKALTQREKEIDELQFFGDKTPSTNPSLHISLITKLLKTNNIVIDTDGWIRGVMAYRHKMELIYSVDPDYIITFEEKNNLFIPKEFKSKVRTLKKVPLNLSRSREERVRYRRELYKKYFEGAKEIRLNSELLFGEAISDRLYVSWGEFLQISDEEPCEGRYIYDLKGLLVGLTNKGKVVGAGVISDYNKDYITVKTPLEKADGILLGYLSLNDQYEEKRVLIRKCSES